MSAKLEKMRRKQYKAAIVKFCASDIGRTLDKRLKLYRNIIIASGMAIVALTILSILLGVSV